ncbi:hypothetical protein [Empedobacter sp. UBA5039]|uniref:hypothetical protein n=1 Tax=Empedobacter sp. UBA5039 TaxID=1946439 RepID=UPI0025B96738|nr:hypothetical protein [Empedobacter sp. UBA5039]
MKKLIFTLLFLPIGILYAQNSTKLVIKDTRSINEAPNNKNAGIEADFKFRTAIGVPGSGSYSTNLTISPWTSADNSGGENHQLNFNQGGIFYRKALPLATEWGAWQQLILANSNGNVGIGTNNPDAKLTVKGNIHTNEVKVDLAVPADYVFQKYYSGSSTLNPSYQFRTLNEIKSFTEQHHHLPDLPSAKEIQENGLKLGEMNNLLLQKIEELTLHLIEQNSKIDQLTQEINKLKQN